jgi:O-antigen/teichoic acid export membrane protein
VFTFALSFVTLVTVLADFGQNVVLTREVARRPEEVHRYFVNNVVLQCVLALPALAAAFAVVAIGGRDRETQIVVLLLGFAVLFELLRGTCFAIFEAHQRLVFVPIALIAQRLVTSVAGIGALLAGAGVILVSVLYLAGAVLAFAIALWLLVRYVVRPRFRVTPAIWKPLMRAAIPVGLAGVFGTVLFRVDTAMLAAFKSKQVVGDYGAAYRLFESTLFLGWSVGAAVYPVYAQLTPTSTPSLGDVLERSLKLVFVLALPVGLVAAVLAQPVIHVFYGPEFDSAIHALELLAPAIALYPAAYLAGLLLVARHRQRLMTIVMGLVAIENIAGNFVLIPWLSLNGAALGTSVSQALVTVPLLIFSRREVERIHWWRMLAGAAVATLAAGVVMTLLRDSAGLALGAGAGVYLATLFAVERALFPDEARALLQLARRRAPIQEPPPAPGNVG